MFLLFRFMVTYVKHANISRTAESSGEWNGRATPQAWDLFSYKTQFCSVF